MIGALVRNEAGGLLLSDEAPAYVHISVEIVREFFSLFPEIPVSHDATKLYPVKRTGSWEGVKDENGNYTGETVRVYDDFRAYAYGVYNPEQRGYKTFEVFVPPCSQPLCAIKSEWLEVQPNGGAEGVEHTATSPHEGLPIRSYRGVWLESITLKHSVDTTDAHTGEYVRGTVWLITLGGAKSDFPATALDFYASGWIPSYLIDLPSTGLQFRNPQGKIKYSTSLKPPYRGKVLTSVGAAPLKLETTVKTQGPTSLPWDIILSSSVSTDAPSVPHSVVISLQGYGVAVSNRRMFKDTSELTYRQKDYYSLALPYRSAVVKIGNTYRATAVPTTVGHLYSKERSDSNFGGIIAGAIIGAFTGGVGWAIAGAALGALLFPIESNSDKDVSQNTTYNERNDELLFVERAPGESVITPRRYLRHYSSIYGGDIAHCGLVGSVLTNLGFRNTWTNPHNGIVYPSQFLQLHYNRPDTTELRTSGALSDRLLDNTYLVSYAESVYAQATDITNLHNTTLLLLYADRAGADADYFDAAALVREAYPEGSERNYQLELLAYSHKQVIAQSLLKKRILESFRPLFDGFASGLRNMKGYIEKHKKAESEIMAAANAASREPSLANTKQLIEVLEIHLETYRSLLAITDFLSNAQGSLFTLINLADTAAVTDPLATGDFSMQSSTNAAAIKAQMQALYDSIMQYAPGDTWFRAKAKELSRAVETSNKADNFLRKIDAQYALFDFVVEEGVKPTAGVILPTEEDFIRAKTLYIKNYIHALVSEYKTNGASYELYGKLHALIATNSNRIYSGPRVGETEDYLLDLNFIEAIRPGVLFSVYCSISAGFEKNEAERFEMPIERYLDELLKIESPTWLSDLGGYPTIYTYTEFPLAPGVTDAVAVYDRLLEAPPDMCDTILDHFVAAATDQDYHKAVQNPASYLESALNFGQSGYVSVDTAQARLFSAYRSMYALLELLQEIRAQLKDGCAIA